MGNGNYGMAKLNANYYQKSKCLKNFQIFGQEIKNYFPNCWQLIRVCTRHRLRYAYEKSLEINIAVVKN